MVTMPLQADPETLYLGAMAKLRKAGVLDHVKQMPEAPWFVDGMSEAGVRTYPHHSAFREGDCVEGFALMANAWIPCINNGNRKYGVPNGFTPKWRQFRLACRREDWPDTKIDGYHRWVPASPVEAACVLAQYPVFGSTRGAFCLDTCGLNTSHQFYFLGKKLFGNTIGTPTHHLVFLRKHYSEQPPSFDDVSCL